MNEQELQDVIESKKAHIRCLEIHLKAYKESLQKNWVDYEAWVKERKGMCRAVTRANKARNAMGRWTVATQNENDLLRLMLKDRGINADFMWKAKRAMETLEKLQTLVATVGESELEDYSELSAYCRMLEDVIKGEPDNAK